MPVDMQKRRSLLLLLLIPAVVLLILLAGPWKLLDRKNTSVSLKHKEQVDRIILTDSYHSVELNRTDGSWYLFGSEAVSPVTVDNLLYTASRLELTSIVDLEELNGSPDMRGDLTEVSFFRGDKILLAFRAKSLKGRFLMAPAGSEKAYYVSLPGYPELDLGRVFTATPDHYRDHLLIHILPSEIQSITFELASGEAFHFIQDPDGHISCKADNEQTVLPDGEPNELAMKLLFSYFTSIRYEKQAGVRADSIPDSEGSMQKLAQVGVKAFDGEQHSLQIFSYRTEPGAEADLFRALVLYNEEQEALIVNYIYLDVLMRGLSHYFGDK